MDSENSRPELEQLNSMRSSAVTQAIERQMQLVAKLKALIEDWTRNAPHKILAIRAVGRKITHIRILNEELVELVKSEVDPKSWTGLLSRRLTVLTGQPRCQLSIGNSS